MLGKLAAGEIAVGEVVTGEIVLGKLRWGSNLTPKRLLVMGVIHLCNSHKMVRWWSKLLSLAKPFCSCRLS